MSIIQIQFFVGQNILDVDMNLLSKLWLIHGRLFGKFSLEEFFVELICSLLILVILVVLDLSKIDDSTALSIDGVVAFRHIIVPGSKLEGMYLSLEMSVLFLSRVDMRLL
jgi:hypothetical protein